MDDSVAATAVVTATAVKPGWATTEFIKSTVVSLLGILIAVGVIGDGSAETRAFGMGLAGLSTAAYSISRGMTKSGS